MAKRITKEQIVKAKQLRKEMKWSFKRIAKAVGISRASTWNLLEKDNNENN